MTSVKGGCSTTVQISDGFGAVGGGATVETDQLTNGAGDSSKSSLSPVVAVIGGGRMPTTALAIIPILILAAGLTLGSLILTSLARRRRSARDS